MAGGKQSVKKCVLAYSGGLDTSVLIHWLRENYGCEVVAFSANLGEAGDVKALKSKALKIGASKCIVKDLRDEFSQDFIAPAIQANAMYEGSYPLATALGRPLIAKHLVETAQAEGADAIAHGCTGKGNDQVRFEVVAGALDPKLTVLAPLREWDMKTREDEIEYAKAHKIPVQATAEKPYSLDSNIWGVAIESGVLEDPDVVPPEDAWQWTISPEKAPAKGEEVEIGFLRGVPVTLNGRRMKMSRMFETLNEIGGKHGVGRIDMIENRMVGFKARELYEAPAALVTITAHRELEKMCMERDALHFKPILENELARLAYNGLWYSQLRTAISAFVTETQLHVNGNIRMKLCRGTITIIGRKAKSSLYDKALATYAKGDGFDHQAAEGFIKIFGLPSRVSARRWK